MGTASYRKSARKEGGRETSRCIYFKIGSRRTIFLFPFSLFSLRDILKERGEQGMEDDGGELLFELEGTERYLVHALAKAV